MLSSKMESRLLLFSALALSIGLVAVGCQRDGGQASKQGGRTGGDAVAARPASTTGGMETMAPAAAAVTGAPEGGVPEGAATDAETTSHGADTEVTPAEFLPPDVMTPVTEMLVTPGSVVEITAEASSDVVEIQLSDGTSKPVAFVQDAAAGVWRAAYRVPLRLRDDRLGLSITAKNGSQKFRRVWVFLKDARSAASGDSTSG